jgi:hypothetical protein
MSKGDASKDPVHFKVKVSSGPSRDETVVAGLSELGQLARNAFEDKRRKQCLALTTAILKIDPENKEALVIQAWVREDLIKDVTNAKQQVEEARLENSLPLWDRAERLLRGVINVDPDHEEAKALLAEVIPAQRTLAEANPIEDDAYGEQGKDSKRRLIGMIVFGAVAAALVIFFVVRPSKPEASETKEGSAAATPTPAPADAGETGSFEFYVLPQQGVQLSVDGAAAQPVPGKIDLPAGQHSLMFTSEGYASQTLNETIIAGRNRAVPVILKSTSAAAATPPEKKSDPAPKDAVPPKNTPTTSRGSSSPSQPPPNTPTGPPSAAESEGSLAVSAAVPVDVYLGGRNLGTTPITVKLPTGVQTLEYRFQSQTKSQTYVIRANETTRTTVSFDLTVQINAFPWAQVAIEGPEGRALGQTPLSNVVVPVGSMLVFQNPNFPEKRHRVSGMDTAIQVRFP